MGECRFMDDIKKDPDGGWKSKKGKKAEKAKKEDDEEGAISMSEDEDPKPPRRDKSTLRSNSLWSVSWALPRLRKRRRNYVSSTPRFPTCLNI